MKDEIQDGQHSHDKDNDNQHFDGRMDVAADAAAGGCFGAADRVVPGAQAAFPEFWGCSCSGYTPGRGALTGMRASMRRCGSGAGGGMPHLLLVFGRRLRILLPYIIIAKICPAGN